MIQVIVRGVQGFHNEQKVLGLMFSLMLIEVRNKTPHAAENRPQSDATTCRGYMTLEVSMLHTCDLN